MNHTTSLEVSKALAEYFETMNVCIMDPDIPEEHRKMHKEYCTYGAVEELCIMINKAYHGTLFT